MKLSIITPYYKTLEPTLKLAEVLEPQLTDDVEWIIVDDGCHEKELDKLKAKVIHLEHNSGAAGKPRNIGLDSAKGKYIAFIDSDDMITEDYVDTILNKLGTDIEYPPIPKDIPLIDFFIFFNRSLNLLILFIILFIKSSEFFIPNNEI